MPRPSAGSLATLAGLRLLSGVTAAAIIPLSMAFIGDHVAYEQRQATLARFMSGQILGLIGGQVIGGIVGDLLGWRGLPRAGDAVPASRPAALARAAERPPAAAGSRRRNAPRPAGHGRSRPAPASLDPHRAAYRPRRGPAVLRSVRLYRHRAPPRLRPRLHADRGAPGELRAGAWPTRSTCAASCTGWASATWPVPAAPALPSAS